MWKFSPKTRCTISASCARSKSVVDEDAGELVADRLVQKRRRHRRIDAAAQAEHDLSVAHLLPDARAGLFDERAHRPIHRAVADVKDEILENLLAARRVRDFGMKLQAVEFPLWILDRGEGANSSVRADGAKSLRQCRDFVAVAVPDVDLVAESIEEFANHSLMCNMPAPYSRRPLNSTWPPRWCAINCIP